MDTAPIRSEERFDESRVADYLRHSLPDLVGKHEISFEQFPGGHANLTYLARAGDVELVLRRPPLGPVAPKSHDMVREHKVLSRLHQAFPEAPRALLLCTDESIMGKPFFVMDRHRGFVIRESWPEGLADTSAVRRQLADTFIGALIRLHQVDYEALELSDLGHPDGFVERQVAGWTSRWDRAKTRDLEDMNALSSKLSSNLPAPPAATLLHNDFKLDNAMVDETGNVVAIFDWDMATLGDPLIDLATALAYWSEPDDPPERIFGPTPMHQGGFPSRAEFLDRYSEGTGFDLGSLAWYEAFAFYKVAVICEQIYARFKAGQTGDERFESFGEKTERLAAAGLELANS
ncbi:MAG: phosphotransferase family protein [Acidimicrobiia bacterium]